MGTVWALVSTQSLTIINPNPSSPSQVGQSITVPANTIVNIIAYNGTDPYIAPTGTQLVQVPDTKKMLDTYP